MRCTFDHFQHDRILFANSESSFSAKNRFWFLTLHKSRYYTTNIPINGIFDVYSKFDIQNTIATRKAVPFIYSNSRRTFISNQPYVQKKMIQD